MADEPKPDTVAASVDPRSKGWGNIKPAKPGEVRNHAGTNAYTRALARFRKFANAVAEDGDGKTTRHENVLMEWYKSATTPGLKGASDRKLWIEQLQGRSKQSLDLSSADGSMTPAKADAVAAVAIAMLEAKAKDDDGTPNG